MAAGGLLGATGPYWAPMANAVGITGLLPGSSRQFVWRHGSPFSLGIAAGAPRFDGFTLWTRLAPEPLLSEATDDAVADFGLAGMSGSQGDIEIGYE
ncbi:MAG TPA: hypothetical protein VN229_13825, partial [Terriglobales bacterium]|nr:hypothetical protein [Terriglobales bacterium]